jgi:hypothetical protein
VSQRDTDALVADLVRGLRPVRPILRLRTAVALVAIAWAAALALAPGGLSLRPDAGALLARAGVFAAVSLFLAVAGAFATLAALAAREPGREGLGAVAVVALAISAVLAGAGLAAAALAGAAPPEPPLAGDAGCLLKGVALGALPGATALALAARGAPARPPLAFALAGAGSVAAGALAVHLGCGVDGLRHVSVSHALAPAAGALLALLAPPLLARLRRAR